jgi:hypothetical protein
VKGDWFRGCAMKRAYATEADAVELGSRVYMCLWCGKWHRTGAGKPADSHGRRARFEAIWSRHLKRLGRIKA